MLARTFTAFLMAIITVVPASAATQKQDLVDTAVSSEGFETLVQAVKAADLVETLKGKGPFTLFAPSDEAFARLPEDQLAALLEPQNKAKLRSIFTYHVVAGRVNSRAAAKLSKATSVNGQRLDVTYLRSTGAQRVPSKLYIDHARVTEPDISAANGVIHAIDAVLMPETEDLVARADAAGQFETLLAAANAAGLVDTLQGEDPLTVLAPTDEAFSRLPDGQVEKLLKPENREALRELLTYHVLPGRVYADDVMELNSAETVQGKQVFISTQDDKVFVNDSRVVSTDIEATNGVIHVIDGVLQPKSMSAKQASAAIRKALHEGVPKFNSGDHQGCAIVYRRACKRILDIAYRQ